MDLDNLDIGLEELDIKSVDINPAASINRTSSPSISLSTGVNPGVGASSQSAFTKPPSLSISNNSLDGGSLDFGLDLLANKKKVRPNDSPSSSAPPRAQSPSKPISISFAEKPAAVQPSMSGPSFPSTDFTTIDLEKELASMNLDDVPKMSGPGVPDFSASAAPSYSFDSTPSVSIPQAPQLSYEQIQAQKFDYLCKLERLQKNGVKTSRIFSMSSDLEEIRMEYEKIMYERRLQNSIKMQRQMLITCCSGIEFLNGKFDPFGVQLDDWSGSVNDEIESYDDVFTELYEKYQGQGSMAPELKLMLMVGGSALTYHLSQTMFKKMPNGENIMRNNPELRRQFEEAALKEMGQETPGFAKFASMASGLGREQPPPFRTGGASGGPGVNVDDIDSMINDISNSI
jgi:hypothetical protein